MIQLPDSRVQGERKKLLTLFVGVIVLFSVVSYIWRNDTAVIFFWSNFFWVGAGLAATLRCFKTSRAVEACRSKKAWRWFGYGAASWTLGIMLFAWINYHQIGSFSFPDISTYFLLAFVPCCFLGVINYRGESSQKGSRLQNICDIGISFSVMAIVCLVLYYRPIKSFEGSSYYLIMALMYVLLFISLLVFSTLQVRESRKTNTFSYFLLIISFALLSGIDMIYAYALLSKKYAIGWVWDGLWVVAFLLIYWAALEDEWAQKKMPQSEGTIVPPSLLYSLGPAISFCFLLIAILEFKQEFSELEILQIFSIIVFTFFTRVRTWSFRSVQYELQSKLDEENKKLNAIIEQMPAGLMIFDVKTSQLVFYNQQSLEMLQGDLKLISCSVNSSSGEMDIQRRDHSTITVLKSHSLIETTRGEEFCVTTFVDISEKKKLYLEAQRIAQMREEFLGIASHELRTPLASLKMALQMIDKKIHKKSMDQGDQDSVRRWMTNCLESFRRFERLIDDLISISLIDSGHISFEPSEVNLWDLAQNVIEQYRPEFISKGYEVHLQGEVTVHGFWDQLRIEQILINLLYNAVKYGEGNPIEVVVEQNPKHAILKVRDQGPGIADEDKKRIFEKFVRIDRKNNMGGLGVGLYFAQKLARAQGGDIYVEDAPERGAVFIVKLPRSL